MPKQHDRLVRGVLAAGPKADFEHIAEFPLPVDFHASAQRTGLTGNQHSAGIHGGFVVGRGLGTDQESDQFQKGRLLAARAGQQGAHGHSFVERGGLWEILHGHFLGVEIGTYRFYDGAAGWRMAERVLSSGEPRWEKPWRN